MVDQATKGIIFLIPLKYGVIGQETTGPSGMFKALRTIPVLLDICKDMEELAPDAWLLNFTNPAGMVTEAIPKREKMSHSKAGTCHFYKRSNLFLRII